ncbi:MAG: transposase [Nitrospira sp.]|nr:transposase [Nitrospira sp.]
MERLFRCLLFPFMEDLSARELDRYLEETLAAKWFCGCTLSGAHPLLSWAFRLRPASSIPSGTSSWPAQPWPSAPSVSSSIASCGCPSTEHRKPT